MSTTQINQMARRLAAVAGTLTILALATPLARADASRAAAASTYLTTTKIAMHPVFKPCLQSATVCTPPLVN
jgi:hypothetical protein